ncbi:hypothetical protein V6Z11_A06G218600 [Gossypium hirsutum]
MKRKKKKSIREGLSLWFCFMRLDAVGATAMAGLLMGGGAGFLFFNFQISTLHPLGPIFQLFFIFLTIFIDSCFHSFSNGKIWKGHSNLISFMITQCNIKIFKF